MYVKLSIRNLKGNITDYSIFFITLTFLAAVVYAFFSLGFSPVILQLNEALTYFPKVLLVLTIMIMFICALVVQYAVRFMYQQRKGEFAIYSLIGIEKKAIINIFCIEHLILGIFTFIIGIIIGIILNVPLTWLALRTLDIPFDYQIGLSLKSISLTAGSYLVFFVCGVGRTVFSIKNTSIAEMIKPFKAQYHNKNHPLQVFLLFFSCVLFIFAIAITLFGLSNEQYTIPSIFLGCIALFIGIYLFYNNVLLLKTLSTKLFQRWKLKGIHIYTWGQLVSDLWKNKRQNALLAVLSLLSLGTMAVALVMGNIYFLNLSAFYPYDAEIYIDAPVSSELMEQIYDFTSERAEMKTHLVYYLYSSVAIEDLSILCLSDYNFLRRQIGLEEKTISDDQFLVHCEERRYLEDIHNEIRKTPNIRIGGTNLSTKDSLVFSEAIEQAVAAGNNGYVIVVPDHLKNQLTPTGARLIMTAKDDIPLSLEKDLDTYINTTWTGRTKLTGPSGEDSLSYGVTMKANKVINAKSGYALVAFSALYLSVMILILLGAVISFQQLSTLDENVRNYKTFSALGVSWYAWKREIKLEMAIRFIFPVVIPALFIILFLAALQSHYGVYLLTDEYIILKNGLLAFLIFVFIYITYIAISYRTYQSLTLQKMTPASKRSAKGR